jgi:hypothetical protein
MENHTFEVVVRAGGQGDFTAEPIGFPELKAEAATEKEAVRKVRDSLMEFLATTKIVKVSIPEENPWLKIAGHAADDPDFEEYLEEIRKARVVADEP